MYAISTETGGISSAKILAHDEIIRTSSLDSKINDDSKT